MRKKLGLVFLGDMIRSGVRIGDEQNCVHGRFNNFGLTFTPASRPERTVRDSIPDETVTADPTARN